MQSLHALTVRTGVRDAVRMAMRTNLMLPPEIVAEVDRVAGPRNRSRYVVEAVQARLRRDRLREVWDRSFGILKTEDYPHWATSALVVDWVRALRAEETDPGPDPVPVGAAPEGSPRVVTGSPRVGAGDPEADRADPR